MKDPAAIDPFGLTRLGVILQLARLVILVISKGFVDFNSRRMAERLVRSTELRVRGNRTVGFAS